MEENGNFRNENTAMKEKIPVGGLNDGRERTARRICEPEEKPPPEHHGGQRLRETRGAEGISVT